MRYFLSKAVLLAILLTLAGCGAMSPKPDWQKAADEILDADGDLVDTLSGVTDAASARAAVPNLAEKCNRATNARKTFAPFMNARTVRIGSGMSFDEFGRKGSNVEEQQLITKFKSKGNELKEKFESEVKRLRTTPGLPVEFWKIVEYHIADKKATILGIAANDLPRGSERLKEACDMRDLLSPENFDKTYRIELIDLEPSLYARFYDKLYKAAPGAKKSYGVDTNGCNVAYYSPIKDIKAFAAAIDIGKTVYLDEGQHLLRIQIDPSKLGAKGSSEQEVQTMLEKERQTQAAEAQAQRDRESRNAEKQLREQEKKEAGPSPSDPDYFDQLAERMFAADAMKRASAIDALLKVTPSQMPPAETKGKIARAFKKMAEEDSSLSDDKAVKGLVVWGGKYSVPVLLKLLDKSHSDAKREIIASLGKMQQPEAVPALAALLSDLSFQRDAYDALKEMGSEAEGAVIKVAPSRDEKTCIYALKLLGEWGTDKSVPILRKGTASRNPAIREAARVSLRKVAARQKATKEKEQQ